MTMRLILCVLMCSTFSFSDIGHRGLASVKVEGKYGFIDTKGNFAINPQFGSVGSFSEGLAVVVIGSYEEGKYGFIDTKGNYVINPQFDSADPFSEGLARVRIGSRKEGKYGFIDTKGNFVINPQFGSVGSVFGRIGSRKDR